ncbi:glyoxalase bleomycin resistance protein dioxygenase [Grosmannia clavigera kw1407]|uniref:Glyoxalase bleomycin resistance protein dioxygenase n=1 Tax=Grosmannia clavigera (strain kw1407 / UAMH 11150) TaxID=655863 RepID=F0XAS3_GROCL|nr:glyoxalase bleomycin resistance protein dioxygenase [Grosmannia clavigera kw1407]EFX05399.1 glyoxalase bleomycin resistance protein dioxygenase [Grosmannia clavigera kw1407]
MAPPSTSASVTTTSLSDFDAESAKVLSPSALVHVVLQTANLEAMVEFYVQFLGGTICHRNKMLAFITYDDEHHRIALIGIPSLAHKNNGTNGLDHIAFSFPTLAALLLAYRQRRARGMLPVWSVNHGPTTSLYYKDPDGNKLETQVDNFESVHDATVFMQSPAFAENPIGTDVDPEALIAALQAGTPEAVLKKRQEIGPRGLPDLDNM